MKRLATLTAVLISLAVPALAPASPAPQATVAAVIAPRGPGVWEPTLDRETEWPTWDNAVAFGAPEQTAIGDCPFAAVADWEMLKGYRAPQQSALIREYIAAGGNEEGIYPSQFHHWLLHHGINGVRLRLVHVPPSWMDAEIQGHGAVLAAMDGHVMVVAGFSSAGPEVITYGETRTETWQEWDEGVEEVLVPVVVR